MYPCYIVSVFIEPDSPFVEPVMQLEVIRTVTEIQAADYIQNFKKTHGRFDYDLTYHPNATTSIHVERYPAD